LRTAGFCARPGKDTVSRHNKLKSQIEHERVIRRSFGKKIANCKLQIQNARASRFDLLSIFNWQFSIGNFLMIRTVLPTDTPLLLQVAEGTGVFKPLEIQALREVLDDYHAANKDQGHRAAGYEQNGELVGFVYFAPAAMTDRAWSLWWIVVGTAHQAGGIGGQLLGHAEDDIRGQRGRVLFIETSSLPHYEPTRRFYLKHGYVEAARLADYYAASDDLVFFRKEMSS
jgi:ribosomal protein S18 acetylase RimI-like enzyme